MTSSKRFDRTSTSDRKTARTMEKKKKRRKSPSEIAADQLGLSAHETVAAGDQAIVTTTIAPLSRTTSRTNMVKCAI